MAQEILSTFDGEVDELSLQPGTGAIFEVIANGELIWSRKEKGGFHDIKELKQLVRDAISPDQDLGHIDRKKNPISD